MSVTLTLVGGGGAEVVGAVLPERQVGRGLVELAGVGAVPHEVDLEDLHEPEFVSAVV